MIRTQVYLTDKESFSLKRISVYIGKSQSELIRQAIDQLIENYEEDDWQGSLMRAKGIWENRTDLPDYDKMREEFDRVF